MDIFDFIKKVDTSILVVDSDGNIIDKNQSFTELFGNDISLKKKNCKFKNSFNVLCCMLYPENISDYNPINMAINSNVNFRTIATYQKSADEYLTLLISSSKFDKNYVIEFIDKTDSYKLEDLTKTYTSIRQEADLLKKENRQFLKTKEQAQIQAIKMALLNRIFEALRHSIKLEETLNLAFKELSEIFGFSKVAFAFYDNNKFEIKHLYPQKYSTEINSILQIENQDLEKLKNNKFVISNVAQKKSDENMYKNIVAKPECRILLPVYHSNKLLGVVTGICPHKNLNKINNDMLDAIAAQFSGAIVQSYLFQEINTKNEQLQNAYTKLEQAQVQLINSEKMASLGQLVAGVAHEINTPLASINSNNSIFEKIFSLDEIDKDLIETLKSMTETDKEAIKRISNIVKSLKRFVRLDEAEIQEADINKELDLTLELLKHETKNRIEIIKDYNEIGSIKCYPNLLNQVFMNILMNAVQSIDDKGKIFISTKIIKDKLTISIKDTGMGMDEKTKEKIFKSGFTTKKIGIGTGLGLMISKDIIEKHSGEITFNSKKGEGTEFIIKIPTTQNRKG